MPKVEINGQVVEFATMPSPEDIDHVAAHLKSTSETSTPTTAPGWKTSAAETVGGLVGETLGGPLGAGAGVVAGGEAADLLSGRPRRPGQILEEDTKRFASGAVPAKLGGMAFRKAGELGGMATRALAKKFPVVGRAGEAVAPGVMRFAERGGQAVERVGAAEPALAAGTRGRGALQTSFEAWRKSMDGIFDHVRDLAGSDPVVPTTRLKAAWETLSQRIAPDAKSIPGLEEALTRDVIDFGTARGLETEIGNAAFRGKRLPVGTIPQHDATGLLAALRQDMDEFFATPGGAAVKPELEQAKAAYREGKHLFNETVVGKLWGTDPEKFAGKVFKPGNISETLALKQAIPPEEFDRLAASHLQGVYNKATVGGRYDAMRFAKSIDAYDKVGHLEHMVSPENLAQLRALRDETFRMAPPDTLGSRTLRRMGRGFSYAAAPGAAAMLGLHHYNPEREGHGGLSPTVRTGLEAGGLLAPLLFPGGRAAYGVLAPQLAGQAYRSGYQPEDLLNIVPESMKPSWNLKWWDD